MTELEAMLETTGVLMHTGLVLEALSTNQSVDLARDIPTFGAGVQVLTHFVGPYIGRTIGEALHPDITQDARGLPMGGLAVRFTPEDSHRHLCLWMGYTDGRPRIRLYHRTDGGWAEVVDAQCLDAHRFAVLTGDDRLHNATRAGLMDTLISVTMLLIAPPTD